jgi:hypothetical protein
MTTLDLSYYRRRADAEQAASEQAVDPNIAQIHREMAQRYSALLNAESDLMSSRARMAQPADGAFGEAAFG